MRRDPVRVLVTGAGSGIGRALAVEAAARGHRVALAGRRHEALEETRRLLAGEGHFAIAADLTRSGDRRRVVARLGDAWAGLDILVNNAGVVEGGPLEASDDAALVRVIETNAIAPIALTRDLLAMLERARPSRVVNIGSIFGDIAYPRFAAYSASKYALRGFSSALRRECRGRGIGVTYAAPRATRTGALSAVAAHLPGGASGGDAPEQVARMIWRGIERGADNVYPPGAERLFIMLQHWLPGLVDRSLARISAGLPAGTASPVQQGNAE